MKFSKIHLFFFLLLAQSLAFAQLPPALMHKQDGKSLPLRIDSVDIKITAIGNIAHTEMTLVFYNDLNRRLEGKLYFPLAEGQTVSGFALDVNGQMREGVVIEKQKGRKVFEDIVRRGIDPGLLEYVKGNNFSARVYPIPAKGTRKIRISYEEGLNKNEEGYQYKLPLQFAQVKHFSLMVESRKIGNEPTIKAGKYAEMSFKKQKGVNIGKLEKANFSPNEPLEITFPHKEKLFVYQGLGKIQNREYFYAHFQPEMFGKPKPLPQKVALVWDMSGSAQNRDFEKEFALLKAYFARLGNASVELITFNNELRETYRFTLENGNWQAIRKQIEALNYDGGTQLGALDLAKIEADEILLSSDGLSNIGKLAANISEANGKPMQTPIHTISSLQNAEFSYLRHLAEATGGHFLNLNQLSAQSAVKLLESEPYRFISATYQSGEITEVFPSKPIAVNGNFAISGVLLAENASITLNFGFNGEIKHSETIKLGRKKINTDGTAERIWANLQLQELDRKYQENEDVIASLGTKYSIVTRNTSLIVLERLDDYFRYKIKPPQPVWEEICNKYKLDKATKWEAVLAESENRGIKPYLIEKWNNRKEWYYNQKTVLTGKAKETEIPTEEAYEEMYFDSVSDDEMAFGDFGGDEWGGEEEEIEEETEKISFKEKSGKKSEKGASAKIKLAPWSASTDYVKKLEAAQSGERYKLYLEMKQGYAGNTGFYADVADFFLHQGDTNTALLVASNIAELQLDNHEMLRLLASLLKLCNRYDLAIEAHKQILELRDDEIQSYRDLALAYEGNGDYQLALNTFYEALVIDWAKRRNPSSFGAIILREEGGFDDNNPFNDGFSGGFNDESTSETPPYFVIGTQQVILEELNRLVGKFGNKLNLNEIDKRILAKMPLDMRISVSWDSDNFDMDLWVTDPNGEKCYYGHTETAINGKYTYDNTSGYGPEEFILKDAIAGNYKVEMNYYGTRSQKMLAPVTVTVDFFTNYGLQSEEKQTIVLRLGEQKEVIFAGEIEFDPLKSTETTFSEAERYEEIVLNGTPKTFSFSPDESKMAVITYPQEGELTTRLLMFDVATRQLIWEDSLTRESKAYVVKEESNAFESAILEAKYDSGLFFHDLVFSENGETLSVLVGKEYVIENGEEEVYGNASLQNFSLQKRAVETGKTTNSFNWDISPKANWSVETRFLDANSVATSIYQAGAMSEDIYQVWLLRANEGKAEAKMLKELDRFVALPEYAIVYTKDSLHIFSQFGKWLKSFKSQEEIDYIRQRRSNGDYLVVSFKNIADKVCNIEDLLAGQLNAKQFQFKETKTSLFEGNWQGKYHLLSAGSEMSSRGLPMGLQLVDSETNHVLLEYFHSDAFVEAQFSPKGTYLASSSADNTIRLRELANLAVAAQFGVEKKAEKPTQRLNAGEYAYEVVGKTMVIWQNNEFEYQEGNVLTEADFNTKDSVFGEVLQFLVFNDTYISLQGNSVHAPNYADYLADYSEFFHDASSIIQTQVSERTYLKIDGNWQVLDISKLNEIATLYQQKKTDKAIRKHFWKGFSTTQKEGLLFNSNTMEEAVFDENAWQDVGIHIFALQPLARALLKTASESSNRPEDGISTMQFNKDKSKLIGFGKNLILYDIINEQVLNTFSDLPEAFTENQKKFETKFSENGKQLIFKQVKENDASYCKLAIWDLAQNKFIMPYEDHVWEFQQVGNAFAFWYKDSISVYRNGNLYRQIPDPANDANGLNHSWWLEENVLVQYTDSGIVFHDFEGKEPFCIAMEVTDGEKAYTFSQDQKQLFIFSGKEVISSDWTTRKPVQKWALPVEIQSISKIPNSTQIITTHYDHAMRVWDLAGKQPKLLRTYFGNDFESAYYDSDKKRIVSRHKSGVVCEWEF